MNSILTEENQLTLKDTTPPLTKYNLPDNWVPFVCTRDNLRNVWEKLNQFPILFDDSVRGDFKHFLSEMFDKNSIIMITGDYGGLEQYAGVAGEGVGGSDFFSYSNKRK